MYLMIHLDERGNRVYTLKVRCFESTHAEMTTEQAQAAQPALAAENTFDAGCVPHTPSGRRTFHHILHF